MRLPRATAVALLTLLACAIPLAARPRVDRPPPSSRLVLENGLEVILIPNRTSPLITSVAVVRAGSAMERPEVSGISHMLEHLLFSGTARRTHDQIAAAPGEYGLVNNAHTASEHTAFFVLAAREQFAEALDLQADMLLSSTIPEERLAQEREIIANEIAKDQVQDDVALAGLYAARMYTGGLALPVIGTPQSVRAIPRDAIVAWHQAWYAPNNMTLILMGDFDAAEMEPLVGRLFGQAPPRPIPEPGRDAPRVREEALGRVHAVADGQKTRRLWMGAPAPGMQDPLYPAAQALASLVGQGLLPAVNARLAASGHAGKLTDASAGLDAYARAATWQVRAELDNDVSWGHATSALQDELFERLRADRWTGRDLDRLRLEQKAALLRLWEKPHYFGLDRAPLVAGGGWPLARDLPRRLEFVEPGDLKDLGNPLASPDRWAVFLAGPDAPADAGAPARDAAGPDGKETATPAFTRESRELAAKWKAPAAPPAGPLPLLQASPTEGTAVARRAVRTFLPNGTKLILDSTDDSRIFAAHVMVRDRALVEPEGKSGIAEVLHAMIAAAGTTAHPGERLQEALREIGGTLKTADDPSIPYDDIYLSPEYSYIRLEALDEFAPRALDLLHEILEHPALDDPRAFAMARDQQMARVKRAAASPRDRARLALARSLWGATHPAAISPFGSEADLSSLSAEDVRMFHRRYFHPRNLVVAIGTSHPAEAALPMIESRLGRWTMPGKAPAARRWPPPSGDGGSGGAVGTPAAMPPRVVKEDLGGPQAYVAWGRLTPLDDLPTLSTVAAVLGTRMGRVLREERGLAYSLGSDASPVSGLAQWTSAMGILPEKIGQARDGMREMLLSLVTTPATQAELDAAARDARVRALMRSLSRINRAWKRCVDESRVTDPRRGPGDSTPPASVDASRAEALVRALIVPSDLAGWAEAVVGPPAPPLPAP
jgi:zinc protease